MSKKIAKLLAFALVLVMVFSLVACNQTTPPDTQDTKDTTTPPDTQDTTKDTEDTTPDTEPVPEVDPLEGKGSAEYPAFNLGELTIEAGEVGGGEVGYDVYAGVEGKDYTDEGYYTYNDVTSGMSNLNWNPLSWETNDDSAILDYLSRGFYGFELNSDKSGWSVTCEMAEELPVDVTADYVGQYGISEGETAKAWKIKLNELATWNDGTPINADTYIYSYQQLLDPAQLNRRADSLYAGNFAVYGAANYFNQGRTSYVALPAVTSEYTGEVGDIYIDCWGFWGAQGYVDAEGNECPQYVSALDETAYSKDGAGDDEFSGAGLYNDYFAPGAQYESYSTTYCFYTVAYEDNYSWDNVGFFKTGEYEIVIVTTLPTENPNYYVPYNLSSTYLVKEDLFESLKNPDDPKVNTYGTSLETTASYGPYMMTYFELDKLYTLERNENWYGYKDGKHLGQYQTDKINVQLIDKHETQLLAFLNGEIDGVGLQSADMEKYGSSDYIRFTPQSYTTKLTFNTDETALKDREGKNATVLGNLNFRKAFSLAIDRTTFAQSYTAAGSAGYGMLNYMYVYDPFTGASYRNSDGAKAALCKLYGLTWGEDGDFEDIDEAYEAITGYDMAAAREAMQLAFEETTADGTYDGGDVVLTISVYQSDDIYVQMFNYLNNALKEACVGTGFEGKVSLEMKVDADYYDSMYSGSADIIFSTWGGAAYSPFTMLYECYCDAGINDDPNQMEYGFDSNAVYVALKINGHQFVETLQTWARWMDAQDIKLTSQDGELTLDAFGNYDAESRCNLFAGMEYVYLANYVNTPMYYRNVGSLVSQKGDYAVTEYVDLVGFGGIAFYTYNYTDAEWAEVAGTLEY
ncbi:MAG: hypothetical protein IJU57_04955 [Clostridia bacterium]|nr:hypothetical protein [Clostridia bacterium]